jgi:hypothetical protein
MAKAQGKQVGVNTGFTSPDSGFDTPDTQSQDAVEPTVETTVDDAPVETETAPEEASGSVTIEGIRYLGKANRRILSADDLKRMGAEDVRGGLEWERGGVVPAERMSPSTIDVLARHPEFEVV